MKISSVVASGLVLMACLAMTPGVLTSAETFAEEKAGMSEERKGAISQNCSSIKQGLMNLQKVDSRTRVYLGSTYHKVLNNFLTPLNLRLVKDNKPSGELSAIQTDFAEGKDEFSEKFIAYAQSLEELIAIDCAKEPEDFYEKLVETRKKRTEVREVVLEMDESLAEHKKIVKKLREEF